MGRNGRSDGSNYRDLAVLSIVPVVVAVLTLVSWILANLEIGPYFIHAALAIAAVILLLIRYYWSSIRDWFAQTVGQIVGWSSPTS